MRAANDPEHLENILKLMTGMPLNHKDLDLYKELSRIDLQEEEWLRAPMIVATNMERFLYSDLRSVSYGIYSRTPVIRWPMKVKKGTIETMHSIHYEYFVAGCDAVISTNIKKELGLVNALNIRMHSLIVDNPQDRHKLDLVAASIENSPNVLTREDVLVSIDQIPDFVIVEVTKESLEILSREKQQHLKLLSISQNEVLIPIAPQNVGKTFPVYSSFTQDGPLFDVEVCPHFPINPTFAMTVNKAQGQTLDRIIVAISKRPGNTNFSYEALNVALTRVKDSKNLRLFLIGNTALKRQDGIRYLFDLTPDPSIDFFFKSYIPSEVPWYEKTFLPSLCVRRLIENALPLIR